MSSSHKCFIKRLAACVSDKLRERPFTGRKLILTNKVGSELIFDPPAPLLPIEQ